MARFIRNGVGGGSVKAERAGLCEAGHVPESCKSRFCPPERSAGTTRLIAHPVSWIAFMFSMLIIVAASPEWAAAASGRGGPQAADLSFDPPRPETGGELKLKLKLVNAVRAEVRWFINDEEADVSYYDGLSGNVPFKKPLKAGQIIKASVTPFDDSGAKGATVVKSVTCVGAPPLLKLVRQRLEGDTYTAKIEAKDPQEGKITLSLEGPEGMKIDQSGNITWQLKKDQTGQFQVKVVGKDEKGAEAEFSYTVTIRKERK